MKHIKTQKIYTFPDRKLYGEYCLASLMELRIKITKGEIKEELCYLDENGFANCFDDFGIPEKFHESYLETLQGKLLRELLQEQMKKRTSQR